MGVFAASALTFMLSAMFGGFWMTGMQLVLLLVGPVLCAYSMARSAGHVWRLGVWGWTRPRWWFELGNIAWIVVILDVSLLTLVCPLPPNLRAWLDPLQKPIFWIFGGVPPCAIVLSGVGCCLSVLHRRRPRGKAFACVIYFFGMTMLIGMAFLLVPLMPQGAFVETVALAALAVAGLSALLAGVIALEQRWNPRPEDRNDGTVHLPSPPTYR